MDTRNLVDISCCVAIDLGLCDYVANVRWCGDCSNLECGDNNNAVATSGSSDNNGRSTDDDNIVDHHRVTHVRARTSRRLTDG
jgi:hypothetical protein